MFVKLWINNNVYEAIADADMMLLDLLRKLGFKSVKRGCDTTNCGLCTVYMDDLPVLSCSVPAARADGHKITTLEGVLDEAEKFTQFMAMEGAEQCGYCNPGFVMNVLAMKRELKDPTEEEIREFLEGNLCRCTGYEGHLRAINHYLKFMKEAEEAKV